MYTKESIAALKEQIDIVELVGRYCELVPKGKLLWCRCPFHEEKTPSCKIDPKKGTWHCFGCKAGGDAIDFVMKAEKISYSEAVEKLVALAGATLENQTTEQPCQAGPQTEESDGKQVGCMTGEDREEDCKPFINAYSISDAMMKALDSLLEMERIDPVKRRKEHVCIPTRFLNIEQHTLGLWPGEVTVVTGDARMGKSSFASNVAVNAALKGVWVLFVAPGFSVNEIVMRMWAAYSRIPVRKMLRGEIDKDGWGKIARTASDFARTDLHICNNPKMTINALFDMIRSTVPSEDKALVVIDGAELLASSDGKRHNQSLHHAAGGIVVMLKQLAREIDASVLVTMPYSCNRFRQRIDDCEEVLDALPAGVRDVADSILGLAWRFSDALPNTSPSAYIADVLLAKHRLCPPAKLKLAFIPEYLLFMDDIDDPEMNCYDDERVDELAFYLGMDRASVIDALASR